MGKGSTRSEKIYLGFDVSQEKITVFGIRGETVSQKALEIVNSRVEIRKFLSMFDDPGAVCVVMETGTHSAWLSRLAEDLGFEVIVSHARDLQLIYAADRKNDALDAEKLARLAQFDRKLLHPVKHMDEERQKDLLVLKARALLVKQRTQTVNAVRGFLRSFGESDEGMTVENMRKSLQRIRADLRPIFAPLLAQLNYLELGIKDYDRQIRKLCKKYPATGILRQIKGVGPETSLAFVLLVGDPKRFADAARACAFFGLVPKQDQSGNVDKQLGISKHGSALMRRLLIQAAQYIMGPFGEDCELRDFGRRIASRGGKIAQKKARVAVARKLIPLMLALWKNPEQQYDPHYRANQKKANQKRKSA